MIIRNTARHTPINLLRHSHNQHQPSEAVYSPQQLYSNIRHLVSCQHAAQQAYASLERTIQRQDRTISELWGALEFEQAESHRLRAKSHQLQLSMRSKTEQNERLERQVAALKAKLVCLTKQDENQSNQKTQDSTMLE